MNHTNPRSRSPCQIGMQTRESMCNASHAGVRIGSLACWTPACRKNAMTSAVVCRRRIDSWRTSSIGSVCSL